MHKGALKYLLVRRRVGRRFLWVARAPLRSVGKQVRLFPALYLRLIPLPRETTPR